MIYHHLFWEITRPGTAALAIDGFPLPWLAALSNGWLGVNVFFVLSGFVLVLPYARGARTMKTLGDWKDFYVRRWLRLMPFYYFSLLIAFAFMHHLEPGDRLFMVDAVVMGNVQSRRATLFSTLQLGSLVAGNRDLVQRDLPAARRCRPPLRHRARDRRGSVRELRDPRGGHAPITDSLIGRLDDFVVAMALCHLWTARGAIKGGSGVALAVLSPGGDT